MPHTVACLPAPRHPVLEPLGAMFERYRTLWTCACLAFKSDVRLCRGEAAHLSMCHSGRITLYVRFVLFAYSGFCSLYSGFQELKLACYREQGLVDRE